jgi:hypothetical protein
MTARCVKCGRRWGGVVPLMDLDGSHVYVCADDEDCRWWQARTGSAVTSTSPRPGGRFRLFRRHPGAHTPRRKRPGGAR